MSLRISHMWLDLGFSAGVAIAFSIVLVGCAGLTATSSEFEPPQGHPAAVSRSSVPELWAGPAALRSKVSVRGVTVDSANVDSVNVGSANADGPKTEQKSAHVPSTGHSSHHHSHGGGR